jgi:hypothetical protein
MQVLKCHEGIGKQEKMRTKEGCRINAIDAFPCGEQWALRYWLKQR